MGLGGYQLGNFPAGWSEWNDRYRDTMRAFWHGGRRMLGGFAERFAGSRDLFRRNGRKPTASINFIAAHDGFTLRDTVSYNDKHNEANLEDNRDGHSNNHSWNCGVEGPTDDAAVIALRRRQVRNMLTTLFFSQGVPMLLAGDELYRTQRGNNNAYCQDNEISWVDWSGLKADDSLLQFVRGPRGAAARAPGAAARHLPQGRVARESLARHLLVASGGPRDGGPGMERPRPALSRRRARRHGVRAGAAAAAQSDRSGMRVPSAARTRAATGGKSCSTPRIPSASSSGFQTAHGPGEGRALSDAGVAACRLTSLTAAHRTAGARARHRRRVSLVQGRAQAVLADDEGRDPARHALPSRRRGRARGADPRVRGRRTRRACSTTSWCLRSGSRAARVNTPAIEQNALLRWTRAARTGRWSAAAKCAPGICPSAARTSRTASGSCCAICRCPRICRPAITGSKSNSNSRARELPAHRRAGASATSRRTWRTGAQALGRGRAAVRAALREQLGHRRLHRSRRAAAPRGGRRRRLRRHQSRARAVSVGPDAVLAVFGVEPSRAERDVHRRRGGARSAGLAACAGHHGRRRIPGAPRAGPRRDARRLRRGRQPQDAGAAGRVRALPHRASRAAHGARRRVPRVPARARRADAAAHAVRCDRRPSCAAITAPARAGTTGPRNIARRTARPCDASRTSMPTRSISMATCSGSRPSS